MNAVWIVLPILTLLMFDLGLTLKTRDFVLVARRPKPIAVGMIGQLVFLPAIAYGLGLALDLDPLFFLGLMLIACSPGGSSSNIFSMLAKGDVALSVSLTAISSVLTLFTIPVIIEWFALAQASRLAMTIELPMGRLILQNLVLMLLPIAVGMTVARFSADWAQRAHRVLSKIAMPALVLLVTLFFIEHKTTIVGEFANLAPCLVALIVCAMGAGLVLSRSMGLSTQEERTILIEIGMQNAAQAIATASSPFVFNNDTLAIPAILYALLMNLILLTYVAVLRRR